MFSSPWIVGNVVVVRVQEHVHVKALCVTQRDVGYHELPKFTVSAALSPTTQVTDQVTAGGTVTAGSTFSAGSQSLLVVQSLLVAQSLLVVQSLLVAALAGSSVTAGSQSLLVVQSVLVAQSLLVAAALSPSHFW